MKKRFQNVEYTAAVPVVDNSLNCSFEDCPAVSSIPSPEQLEQRTYRARIQDGDFRVDEENGDLLVTLNILTVRSRSGL